MKSKIYLLLEKQLAKYETKTLRKYCLFNIDEQNLIANCKEDVRLQW